MPYKVHALSPVIPLLGVSYKEIRDLHKDLWPRVIITTALVTSKVRNNPKV